MSTVEGPLNRLILTVVHIIRPYPLFFYGIGFLDPLVGLG